MINILLVEDHNIVRSGIKMLLETEADFNIIGEAINGLDALALVKELDTIDIILTDINMEGIDGITLIKEVKQLNPAIAVVVLSMHDNEKYVMQSFAEEASGYILKSVSSNELIFALRFIASGQNYVCSEIVSKMIATLLENKHFQIDTEKSEIEFSSRELEILILIAEGYTNLEMAEKLFISKRTVEGHRQALIDKTNSKNTAALIRFAVLRGLIQ